MNKKFLLLALAWCSLFIVPQVLSAQTALVLNGGNVILYGGTTTNKIYVVVNESSTSGISRLSGGGYIISEGQYNYVTWNTGTGTGSYVLPFAASGDYIPFTFNKTTSSSSNIFFSTWATNQQNVPHPGVSDVPAVYIMTGLGDSVTSAIDRFWDIQSTTSVTADLTFSYRGSENTTSSPTDQFKAQHWNGNTCDSWDASVGSGNTGVTSGVGTVGAVTGQTTFSPWVLTRANAPLSNSLFASAGSDV